jgi:flagellar biosynthesis/type III secretory pathway protein FliH
MISATLYPPDSRPETSIEAYRAALALARREQAEVLQQTRKRSKRYSQKARQAGYQAGYAHGVAESKGEFLAILEGLRAQYQNVVDQAREDVMTVAHHIVENVISSYVERHPQILRDWITDALSRLQHTRGLTLRYHPRYHVLLQPFLEESKDLMKSLRDPTLGERDFSIQTDAGEISFAWREMLRSLSTNS